MGIFYFLDAMSTNRLARLRSMLAEGLEAEARAAPFP